MKQDFIGLYLNTEAWQLMFSLYGILLDRLRLRILTGSTRNPKKNQGPTLSKFICQQRRFSDVLNCRFYDSLSCFLYYFLLIFNFFYDSTFSRPDVLANGGCLYDENLKANENSMESVF